MGRGVLLGYRRSAKLSLKDRPAPFNYVDKDWPRSLRDTQRMRAYRAEWAFQGLQLESNKLGSWERTVDFLEQVLTDPWFVERLPYFDTCFLEENRRLSGAQARRLQSLCVNRHVEVQMGRIEIGPYLLRTGGKLVVLHELAHAVLPQSWAHSPRWARCLLEFVGHFMGPLEQDLLVREHRKCRVQYLSLRDDDNGISVQNTTLSASA